MPTLKKLKLFSKKVLNKLNLLPLTWLDCLGQKEELRFLLGEFGYYHLLKLINYPDNKEDALLQAATFLGNVGLSDHAVKAYEAHLAIRPQDSSVHIYLQTLMYSSPVNYDHKYVHEAHVKWGNWLQTYPKYTNYSNALTADRRLKIGYTCHFITNSTSSTLLLPILKAHHKDSVEIFLYSDQNPEQIPDEVRNLVEHWRDTYGLDDDTFCKQVRSDKIDILFELNGHCIPNRYRALTRKPAPVQVSYYNYSSTCGVPGIDYILVGEEVDIDKLQPYYSEKIFHKKGVVLATIISDYFPPISPPPVLKNGYITFGSFGQAHKVSREQIQLWCEVLKRVPESKFYMKAGALDCAVQRSVFENHFTANGIDPSRVLLEGPSDYITLLNSYSKVDISLDTYPFGGGTTPIEAAIQGVPTISLIGERYCSQHGICSMHNIGHDEFISHSKSEFIHKSVELASDHEKLTEYRYSLREDLSRSPRGDMQQFITDLEDACKTMWVNYLEQHKIKDLSI